MDIDRISTRNLDEGLFYVFMIFSAYMVKEAFVQFNVEAIRNHTKLNKVDSSTQTYTEQEEKEYYDLDNEIQNTEFYEAKPPSKRKYLWFI
jgi:hypothetical protein